jgi:hypothetical protein
MTLVNHAGFFAWTDEITKVLCITRLLLLLRPCDMLPYMDAGIELTNGKQNCPDSGNSHGHTQ